MTKKRSPTMSMARAGGIEAAMMALGRKLPGGYIIWMEHGYGDEPELTLHVTKYGHSCPSGILLRAIRTSGEDAE